MKLKLLLRSKQKGFTLIEMLVYFGVLSILVGAMSMIFGAIIDTQLDSEATSSVDQDSRYILSKLSHDFSVADKYDQTIPYDAVTFPTTLGVGEQSLQMTVNSINYTYSLDANGNLQLNDGTNTFVLNSVNTSISGLTFTRIGNGTENDTVRVSFILTSRTQEKSGPESRSIQTTLGFQ